MSLQCQPKGILNKIQIIQRYQPPKQFIEKLKDIQKSNLAINFYLRRLIQKSFITLKCQDRQFDIYLMRWVFFSIKKYLLQRNKQQTNKKICLILLKRNFQQKIKYKQLILKAKLFENWTLKKYYFKVLKIESDICIKQKKLVSYLKKQNFQEFEYFIKHMSQKSCQRKSDKLQVNKIIEEFNQVNILRNYYYKFMLYAKIIKLQKALKKKCLNKLLRKSKNFIQNQNMIIKKFTVKKQIQVKKKIFLTLKDLIIDKDNQKKLQCYHYKTFFYKLTQFSETIRIIKSIRQANQTILSSYIQEKNKVVKCKYFQKWIEKLQYLKDIKRQKQMMKQYASIKQKQTLLKISFGKLFLNAKYSKMQRQYSKRLKLKYFQKLKQGIINQSLKLQKILAFIKNRQQVRYFNAIKTFNFQTNKIIKTFQMKKFWNSFIFTIAKQYFEKSQKAEQFTKTALLRKVFFSFRKQVQINKKSAFCATYINLIKPLRNWRKIHRVLSFIGIKNHLLQKKVFFQFKVIAIRSKNGDVDSQFYIQKCNSEYPFHSSEFKSMIQSYITMKKDAPTLKDNMETSFFNCSFQKQQKPQSQNQGYDQIDRKVQELLAKIKRKSCNTFKQ